MEVPPGLHRHRSTLRIGGVAALVVALAASVRLLTLPAPHPPGTDWTLKEAYPSAAVVDVPGYVEGDWAYQPMLFLDGQTSLGTATPSTGGSTALVILGPEGTLRTVRTLGAEEAPQFGGFTTGDDRIAWLEQTAGDDGQGDAAIWIAGRDGSDARVLTRDLGDFAFFNSQYDLLIRDSRVYWVAAAPGDGLSSEIRSISVTGGTVSVRRIDGGWQAVGGDWLVTAMTAGGGATALVNWKTGRRTPIPNQQSELVSCSSALCRVLVLGGDGGATRIDVMRTDGSQRHRAASGSVTAALVDVGLLDRWEVYSRQGSGASALARQQVLLYDVRERRTINLSDGAGQIMGRNGFVWWGSGMGDDVTWHVLDLHTLR
ncbi:MAG: hypothetical protein HOU81_13415 [Hamadaea sp.]|uniref:hypothetical protein n=1 Tax=Hamadaea sp. TaxID=2024425 RepID=UPI0017D60FD8|nr:hypothetical protein [Hamadaea sp.]NUR71816.1 hypothetical protein [Hamadaea sp.]NUT19244.1 hypothetical protein [Hamadaea sp.]